MPLQSSCGAIRNADHEGVAAEFALLPWHHDGRRGPGRFRCRSVRSYRLSGGGVADQGRVDGKVSGCKVAARWAIANCADGPQLRGISSQTQSYERRFRETRSW